MNETVKHAQQPRATALSRAVYVSSATTMPDATRSLLAGTSERGVELRTCAAADLDASLGADADSRACVFVESPSSAAMRSLAAPVGPATGAVIGQWCQGARDLLRVAMTAPGRCLFVSVEEAQAAGAAWRSRLDWWLGPGAGARAAGAAAPQAPAAREPSALDRIVACALVQAHPEADRLHEQLLACCIQLDGSPAAPTMVPDPAIAASELQTLREQCATPPSAPDPVGAPTADDANDLLERLFATQEELETALLSATSTRSELEGVRQQAAAELRAGAELQQLLQTTEADLKGARQHVESLSAAVESTRSELDAMRAQADEARGETDSVRQEAALLLEKLHEAHEQLGHHFLEWRALTSTPSILAHGRSPVLRATGVHPAQEQATGVHRHLDLVLRDVSLDGRRLPDTRARLVEHLGRPGVVLFHATASPPLLSAWRVDGQEAGVDYMLIVPGDDAGQAALAHMGATDWRIACDVAGLMLRGTTDAGNAPWANVAARLCRSLAELPTRLRYDELQVSVEDGGGPVRVTLGRVQFGALAFPELAVQWNPGGRLGTLELLPPAAGPFLPLTAWPVTDEGTVAAQWRLPLRDGVSEAAQRRSWATLTEGDREFLLALLDALPAAGARAPSESTARLAEAARQLHRKARALSRSLAWRGRLRQLIQRGTRS